MRWVGVLIAFALWATPASAATFTVSGTADGTGSCAGTKCPTLRAAVAAANLQSGSTIQLGKGNFTLGQAAGGQLVIPGSTTVTGAGAASTTIAQTDGIDRVLTTESGVTLKNLAITGGRLGAGAAEPGAGIYALGPLTLSGVTVSGNDETASAALNPSACCEAVGGIASLSSLTLNGSKITGNSATGSAGVGPGIDGGGAVGGIYATQFQPIAINKSVISNNTATGGTGGAGAQGGGAYGGVFVIDGAPMTVSGSTFSGNNAQAGAGGAGRPGGPGGTSDGGAIFTLGLLNISASTFEHNVAASGAGGAGIGGAGGPGADAYGGAVAGGSRASAANSIVNSTFYANRVTGGAGGTGTPAGSAGVSAGGGLGEDTDMGLTLVSSTFDANLAQGPGGEYGGNLYDQFSPIAIAETIFAAGAAANGPNCALAATETDDGHNLETTSPSQCGLSGSHQDLIGAKLKLPAPGAHGGPAPTIALPAGSAPIHAGGTCLNFAVSGNPPLKTDERGVARPVPCDIGAYQTDPKRHHRHHHHHHKRHRRHRRRKHHKRR